MDTKYYKITDAIDNYHGQNTNAIDGHCFTIAEHISLYYDKGNYIREVALPTEDDQIFFKDPIGMKWHASKVILSETYSLNDPSTYAKLNLPMMSMDDASAYGHTAILDWWLKSGLKIVYTKYAIDDASRNGHIRVLDWWLHSGLELFYSTWSMDDVNADAISKIAVLNWWLKSGLPLKYSNVGIDLASGWGKIYILNWWLHEFNLPLKYSKWALDNALSNEKLDVLIWWRDSGLPLKCSDNNACNSIVAQWQDEFKLILKYSGKIVDYKLIQQLSNDITCMRSTKKLK